MDTFARECLDAHNEYRRKHGSPPLVLSQWLMGVAQDWANNNAARGMMYHSNHPNDCENIFATSGKVASGRTAVDCFYNEIKYYRFGGMGFTMQTGHFTQVVWKSTTMMGVGKATGRNGWTYVVVSYSPRGNVTGQFGANVLPLGTAPPAQPAPTQQTKPSQTSKPSQTTSGPDTGDLVTKPAVRASYLNAPAAEIVAAIFSGKLGNCMGDRLNRGYHLSTNQYLMSQNRQYAAILQENGNFVLYKQDKGGEADFATDTDGEPANQVQLRNNGLFAVVDKSNLENPLWKSHKDAEGEDCFLVLRNDGKLIAYRGTSENSGKAYFTVPHIC